MTHQFYFTSISTTKKNNWNFFHCTNSQKYFDYQGLQNRLKRWRFYIETAPISLPWDKLEGELCDKWIEKIYHFVLTHWGRVTHICVSKLTIIGSDNGLSPDRHQSIIWTNAGLLLIGPLGTNFSEIVIEILTFSFKKIHLKVSSARQQPFCIGLNVLKESTCTLLQWSMMLSVLKPLGFHNDEYIYIYI